MKVTGLVPATRLLQFSHQFHKYFEYRFAPLLEETGFSMREFHVLLFFVNNPAFDTARDVTEYRGLAKSQVSQAVELLCGRGLLERRPDSTDRRVIHLLLTESGQALATRASALQAECYARLTDGFSPQELTLFHDLLSRVLDNGSRLSTTETL